MPIAWSWYQSVAASCCVRVVARWPSARARTSPRGNRRSRAEPSRRARARRCAPRAGRRRAPCSVWSMGRKCRSGSSLTHSTSRPLARCASRIVGPGHLAAVAPHARRRQVAVHAARAPRAWRRGSTAPAAAGRPDRRASALGASTGGIGSGSTKRASASGCSGARDGRDDGRDRTPPAPAQTPPVAGGAGDRTRRRLAARRHRNRHADGADDQRREDTTRRSRETVRRLRSREGSPRSF